MPAFAAHVRPELHGVRERVRAVRWRGCDEWGWRGGRRESSLWGCRCELWEIDGGGGGDGWGY